MSWISTCVTILHLHCFLSFGIKANTIEKTRIGLNIIPNNYEKSLSPMVRATTSTKGDESVNVVTIGTKNHIITGVSVKNMNIQIFLTIFFYWWDPRLNDSPNSKMRALPSSIAERLWTPQIKLKNCIGCQSSIAEFKNTDFMLVEKQQLLIAVHDTFTLACKFDLSYYPFDRHTCGIEFEAFKPERGNPVKLYADEKYQTPNSTEGIIVQSDFEVVSRTTRPCIGSNLTYIVTSDCLEEIIEIRRLLTSHILDSFLPSIILVIISWMSFYLPAEMITSKLSLCLAPLISLIVLYSNTKHSTPETSSFKAIHLWMFVCILFIFLALLAFGLVSIFYQKQIKNQQVSPLNMMLDRYGQPRSKMKRNNLLNSNIAASEKAGIIDKPARIVIPISFSIFNIIFWAYFLAHYF